MHNWKVFTEFSHKVAHRGASHRARLHTPAMARTRKCKEEYISLRKFMRRRDIPRAAREEEYERAHLRALQAYQSMYPHDLIAKILVVAQLDPDAIFLWPAICSLRLRAMEVALFLCTYIPRPLRNTAGLFPTIQFGIWTTPSDFASVFRLQSEEKLRYLAELLDLPETVVCHTPRRQTHLQGPTYRCLCRPACTPSISGKIVQSVERAAFGLVPG